MQGSNGGKGFKDLVSDLSQESMRLVRLEAELAEAEISSKIPALVKHFVAIAIGGVLIALGLVALVGAAVVALSRVVAPWGAFLIVGFAICLLGLLFVVYGRSGIKPEAIIPQMASDNLRKAVRWLKGGSR